MSDIKALILAADDLDKKAVSVPEWGVADGSLYVRTLTGLERDAWEASIVRPDPKGKGQAVVDMKEARASLLVRCLVDAEGKRVFSDADVKALGAKSAKVIGRLYDEAAALNGLRDEDVEELVKNSTGGPDGDSPSA